MSGGGRSIPGLPWKKPSGLNEKPTCSTFMHGKSSGRGTWATPNACHSTTSPPSSPPSNRSALVHAGSPWPGSPWGVNSPAGKRSSSACGVTHRFLVANSPLAVTAQSEPVSSTGCAGPRVNGTSLYPTDWDVMGLMTDGLETLQVLALVWSHTRTAPPSVASRVLTGPNALAKGSPIPSAAPTHPVTRSTSSTTLLVPSTSTSRRAQNMCWCTWAFTPGATNTPCLGASSPAERRLVESIPESLISYSMLPSWLKYQ
mmetsp:Transcript_11627/g.54159  ORF Transcript_11627/g.54159 Transcript_11627/m.54159 type:complete len:258 (+) Transcript_11627:147-920(+)